ncbi:carbohydrate ABC transporter permease [Salipaludibacillus sp. CUR1]|uniref:carbohydrate ABC transporter permease n=1 Tax=Salipaludibacillus sp. CUR1 TaxID=2820003 RepID=UPI001E4B9E3B|nr:carbohydrate ABC transporter permease [Salipaludibacillus sp. CUR1]MCE7791757.1 carbohydrate ABC transporter permease [Salipaludibacillus sp. CUR1]
MKNKVRSTRLPAYIAAYGLVAIMLIPIVWMFWVSFKPINSIVTVIGELLTPPYTMESYVRVQESSMIWRWTINSVIVGVIQTAGTLLLSSLAAFAISRIPFKGKTFIFLLILAGLMVPVEATIVPLYEMIVQLGWVNSYPALILPGIALPLGVLILKQFYDGIPNDLMEAAKIDGANLLRIWWSIFLPLSRTSMAALAIFIFVQSWNNFLWPLLVANDQSMMTLPVAIPTFQSSFTTDLTVPMAANVLASIPALIFFLIFQKQIIKGIAMTGIK